MTDVRVRPARPEDVPELARLNAMVHQLHEQELPGRFPPHVDPAVRQHFIEAIAAGQLVLIAQDAGTPVGFVHAEAVQRPASPLRGGHRHIQVHGLGVDESARRRGIGRLLMAAVEEEADRCGASEVRLQRHAFNEEARLFYEALGYRTTIVTMSKGH